MGSSSDSNGKLGDVDIVELTGKVMIVAIILLFFIVVFFLCLHLYAKWFWYRHEHNATTTNRRRRRLDFAAGHQEITVEPCMSIGLNPCVLKSVPVVIFDRNEFIDGLECAVCLCEVCEGEKARILPTCNHGFHVECIDMWFQSHSTCPLCRNPVSNSNSTLEDIVQAPARENSGDNVYSTEAPSFRTNVLFWGDQTQVSSCGPCMDEDHLGCPIAESSSSSSSSSMVSTSNRPDEMLVIDIPRTTDEEEERKFPVPTRFRSPRTLSCNRKANPPSPENFDLEDGRGQI